MICQNPALTELKAVINNMSQATAAAMLEAIDNPNGPVIGGAYTHQGGVCPMLGALRAGAPPHYVPFAEAWDRYLGLNRKSGPRPATQRELVILKSLLAEKIFPACERVRTRPERCPECTHTLKLDYYAKCIFCQYEISKDPLYAGAIDLKEVQDELDALYDPEPVTCAPESQPELLTVS